MRPKTSSTDRAVRIGVDFGTTHTIVALADSGNHPVLRLPFEYEGETLVVEHAPSCIALCGEERFYGPAAVRCFLDRFDEGVWLLPSIKRLLQHWHEGQAIEAAGRRLSVEDLLTEFLTSVRRAVLRALDMEEARLEAVIAVPANASSSQRYVTINSFRRAGFEVIRILDEPTAAGIQFVRERYKRWDRVEADVVVYDLGGGTFDATMLSIRRDRYDPLVTRGISRLGGEDFDEALLALVEQKAGRRYEDRERIEMLQVVREVKEGIGTYTQKLHVDTPEGTISIPIREFHDAVRPLVDRTVDLVQQVIMEAKGRGREADRIVLVGGGGLLAAVPKLLKERFGRARIHQGLYPFAAVAIGAAIQADTPDLEVTGRLSSHFGVIRVREDGSEYVDVIFEKGRPLPPPGWIETVARPPYDPRHNIGRFQYLECEEIDPETGLSAGEAVYWNDILFPYDRGINTEGEPLSSEDVGRIENTPLLMEERIVEEYSLDAHGILTTRISRTIQDRFSNSYNLFRKG
ncbi:MAG: Hsp70 family protein [Deltaproteobacteria bacterium]|nr:Hsp70 family protein [Deltaproteobacteria bacterium]